MSEHVFRFKRGDLEFEVRGDREFVEDLVERWAIRALGPLAMQEVQVAAETRPTWRPPAAPQTIRVHKNISFSDFLSLKEPRTSLDRLLTLAYYLEKYEGQTHYGTTELDRAWSEAFPDDAFSSQLCRDAVKSGYLEEVGGHLTLTFSGEAYVQNGLADRFR